MPSKRRDFLIRVCSRLALVATVPWGGCQRGAAERPTTPPGAGISTPSATTTAATPVVASPATLVLRGAKVATVDDAFSIAESVAIRGNRIVYVGDDRGVEPWVGEGTQVLAVDGKFVLPGLVDAHCHPYALGRGDENNDFFDVGAAKTFDEMVTMLGDKAKTLAPGEWIIGGGWDQNRWPGKALPVHDRVSAVTPNNPVFLYRDGGNSAFANKKALDIAGITKDTPDPYGGQIHRKPDGEPTGFVVNMGNNLIKKHFPAENRPDDYYRERYKLAARRANEVGLTGWHDAGTDPKHIGIYKQLVDRGELTMRSNVMLQNPRLEYDATVAYFKSHRVLNYGGEQMLQVRSVKMFFDGALGSRGARLFEPYDDDPHNTGVFEVPPEHVYEVSKAGLETGMQVCPHSIGPKANFEFLNAVERALAERPVADHRFRSEHAEVVRPTDIPRFAKLGVIASIQPIHCTSDMGFMHDRLGPQRCHRSASPWRSFLDAGVHIASGSDFTVESHRPLYGIYAAITRQDHQVQSAGGWYGDQRMTREEAIRSYTNGPAYAAFLEHELGSLEVGKLADIVVLDQDLLTVEPHVILETQVLFTIVNGKVVYQK
ncbi:MAG: amidohydrolase [Myxococcales bacterium FL481]|nr:MAG: amidohydrolase [Myxococcales bacterium FL481]